MSAREAYHANLVRLATDAFALHAIRKREPGRWLLQRQHDGRWTGNYSAEVIATWHGELYVGGDVDFVLFRGYGDSRDPEAILRWMGHHADVRGYVRSKACIGTGWQLTDAFDDAVAREDVADWLAQREPGPPDDDGDTDGGCPEGAAVLRRALELIDKGHPLDDVKAYLYDEGQESEDVARLGLVVAPRVYYAHAAVRRLCALLDAERAAQPEAAR